MATNHTTQDVVSMPDEDHYIAGHEAGFEAGFEAGRASRDSDIEALARLADFWYFRANNPRSTWPDVKMVNSIIEGMEVNEERRKKWAELDRAEQELFQRARDLIEIGVEDVEIAKEVGLYLPIVQNLRAGVL